MDDIPLEKDYALLAIEDAMYSTNKYMGHEWGVRINTWRLRDFS